MKKCPVNRYSRGVIVVVSLLVLGSVIPTVSGAQPDIEARTVQYRHGEQVLEGYLAYDKALEGKRPGIVVFHEWWGLNDYAKMRARQLAEMGYVAFAADMFGQGKVAGSMDEATKLVQPFVADRQLMRARAGAALSELLKQADVDTTRLAAIGFCFGGTTAIELAMSGANLKGLVTFHASLNFPATEDAKNVKCAVLICHGGEDPSVSQEQFDHLWTLFRDAKLNYQMNIYGGAVHGFTNPANGTDNSKGVAYNERAAKRAWRDMEDFFKEIF